MVLPVLVQTQVPEVNCVDLFCVKPDFADVLRGVGHPVKTDLLNRANVCFEVEQQQLILVCHFSPKLLPKLRVFEVALVDEA